MRIPLVDVDSPQFDIHRRENRTPFHLIRTVAHVSPEVLQAWIAMAKGLRVSTTLNDIERELITTRVTQLAGCEYEFSHHWEEALTIGMPLEQLEDLANWQTSPHFNSDEKALLAFVDELVATSKVSDTTYARLEAAYGHGNPSRMADITLVVGFYGAVTKMLNVFETSFEEGRIRHPIA